MSNYQKEQKFKVNKFELQVHPYAGPPENRFEPGAAVQYGADFKSKFERGGNPKQQIGLLQLIFPQTAVFPTTQVRAWNVDKREPSQDAITMARALYGTDGVRIGAHSEFYAGDPQREIAQNKCWLIDTPRELNSQFQGGVFTGTTTTKFANYVVELSGPNGVIFNQGIQWGYSIEQNSKNPAELDVEVQKAKEVELRSTNEHLDAIARFLGMSRDAIKSFIG
jgi:hypothetical protein